MLSVIDHSGYVRRRVRSVVNLSLMLALTVLTPLGAQAQSWPDIFNPFEVKTLNLEMSPTDWDTIRWDNTNEIEVRARFWADGEEPIEVSVRRKSSRALPSELDPIKVGLKIDIDEYVSQQWHGLTKLSLENGGDINPLLEGMAWQLHEMASQAGYYGPEQHVALASWVRLNVNGQSLGVYTSVEQRDKQFLENRGIRVKGKSWLYEVDDIDSAALDYGDPDSPTFSALCFSPFARQGKGRNACRTPGDAQLDTYLDSMIEMDAMLAQGAVDAFTDNPDALFSHGKNFMFADFSHSGLKRRYLPWDLDAVFRKVDGSIYGNRSRRGMSQTPYQSVLLNHPRYRLRYNAMLWAMTDTGGPLSAESLDAFLNRLQPVLAPALAADPFGQGDEGGFDSLRRWLRARIANVQSQIQANDAPAPRP